RPYSPAGFDPPTVMSEPWQETVSVNGKTAAHTEFEARDLAFYATSSQGRTAVGRVDTAGRMLKLKLAAQDSVIYRYDNRGRATLMSQPPRGWRNDTAVKGRLHSVRDTLTPTSPSAMTTPIG